ncbi:hypothetical protein GCM10017557_82530 [Streptomyces aurantiacus]|uniref:Uncharacterized protein n=1 Tax=Streptomyces aurantiacus TaxID=47760 RepID=A0A7G1PGF9_9ACTN|nr:hypothetical protein GCM10017557_82530 [Streptomyces aurantiacus]
MTRPVTLTVEFGGVVDHPVDLRKHAGFEAAGEIRRLDFGLDFAPGSSAMSSSFTWTCSSSDRRAKTADRGRERPTRCCWCGQVRRRASRWSWAGERRRSV